MAVLVSTQIFLCGLLSLHWTCAQQALLAVFTTDALEKSIAMSGARKRTADAPLGQASPGVNTCTCRKQPKECYLRKKEKGYTFSITLCLHQKGACTSALSMSNVISDAAERYRSKGRNVRTMRKHKVSGHPSGPGTPILAERLPIHVFMIILLTLPSNVPTYLPSSRSTYLPIYLPTSTFQPTLIYMCMSLYSCHWYFRKSSDTPMTRRRRLRLPDRE